LYLPESWTGDGERRAEAGIPDEVEFQKKWQFKVDPFVKTISCPQ
jgi:hypothetical protein